MGEFLTHSPAVWLNPHPSLGRMRKDPEMTVFGESPLRGPPIVFLPKGKKKKKMAFIFPHALFGLRTLPHSSR